MAINLHRKLFSSPISKQKVELIYGINPVKAALAGNKRSFVDRLFVNIS